MLVFSQAVVVKNMAALSLLHVKQTFRPLHISFEIDVRLILSKGEVTGSGACLTIALYDAVYINEFYGCLIFIRYIVRM